MNRLILWSERDLSEGTAWGDFLTWLLLDRNHLVVGLPLGHSTDVLLSRGLADVVKFPLDVSGKGRWDLPLESFDITSASVEAYSKLSGRADFARAHSIVGNMFSRQDPTGTFRQTDRETVLRRMWLVLLSQVKASRPDAAIFAETPHMGFDFALLSILEMLDIPVLMLQPTGMGPQIIPRLSVESVLPVSSETPTNFATLNHRKEVDEIARAQFARLLNGGGSLHMASQQAFEKAGRHWTAGPFGEILDAVRLAARIYLHAPEPRHILSGHRPMSRTARRLFMAVTGASLRINLDGHLNVLPTEVDHNVADFGLVMMHYEPERTSMPEGLPFVSQLDAILHLRALMPAQVQMVVKEHPSTRSRLLRGHVARSPMTYSLLKALPNTLVVSDKANVKELIARSRFVFTLTGKVAFEAVSVGKPVIFGGQPWWETVPGAISIFDSEGCSAIFNGRYEFDVGNVSSWIENHVSRGAWPGVAGRSPSSYSKHFVKLPPGFESLETQTLIAAFSAFERNHFFGS